jgi:hypothetical protein
MRTGVQAKIYARRAKTYLALETKYWQLSQRTSSGNKPSASLSARMAESAIWVSKVRRKYERAARYPWLPLEPVRGDLVVR